MRTSSGAVAGRHSSNSLVLSTFHQLLELTPATENLCYSPFGIQTVLTLVHDFSTPEDRPFISKLFDYGMEIPAENMRAIHRIRRAYTGEPSINLVNSVWLKDPQRFTPEACDHFQRELGCELFTGDFGPSTVREINAWAEKNTKGRISAVVQDLSSDFLMALNVLYFNGKWADPFDKSRTKLQCFTLADGSKISHPRMQCGGSFEYYEDSDCQAVKLDYCDNGRTSPRFSMLVVLPARDGRMPPLLRENGDSLRSEFLPRPGHLELPRFTFRCDSKVTLAMLGLPKLFCLDPSRVITSNTKEVPISVTQRTWIRVDESGTEAAAVTDIEYFCSEQRPRPSKPFTMIVDRPFYFFITDNFTNVILFIGKVANPGSE